MNYCREAFASFRRRVKQLLLSSDHVLEASIPQITSPQASAAVDSESDLVEDNQHKQQKEPVPVPPPPEVRAALPQKLDWPLVLIGFCLASAVDISLHSIQTNAKIPLCLQFLSFSILLAFASLFMSRSITFQNTMLLRVLEQSGIFFAVTAFFTALTTCFHLFLKFISWAIYALSLLAIIIYRSP